MTAAWFVGARNPVAQDASGVRATTSVVEDDSPAELESAPGWNETAYDPHSHAGLETRNVGGAVTPSRKGAPVLGDLAKTDYNVVVDDQVSSAGRAPAIEAQGVWGHGTMRYQESLQPVIRDGAVLGNTVFLTNDQPVQMGAGNAMLPDQQDQVWAAVAQNRATRRSRVAFDASVIAASGWERF